MLFQTRHIMAMFCLCATLGAVTPSAAAEPSAVSQASSALISHWSPLIKEASRRFGIAEDWIKAVMRMESGGHTKTADGHQITSSKGAMGLMQLMPATAVELGVANAFDPKENVDAGARLLKQLLKMYGGDVSLAVGAFNAGPGKVNQAGGLPDYPETLDYVQKVLSGLPFASH